MKISLLIPCHRHHLKYLERSLLAYLNGTRLPDEIIISFDETRWYNWFFIAKIRRKFPSVGIHEQKNRLWHAGNRQFLVQQASGELLIFHDADDTPHPQRIAIVEHWFNKLDIMSLNHGYVKQGEAFPPISENEFDTIEYIDSDTIYNTYFPNDNYLECSEIANAYGAHLYATIAGGACVRKEVFNHVQFRSKDQRKMLTHLGHRAEDYEFCMETLFTFKKSIILKAPIYGISMHSSA